MPLEQVTLGATLRLTSSGVETIGLFEGLAEGRITLTDLSACYGAPCPGIASIGVEVVDRADYAAGSQWLRGGLLGLAIGTGAGVLAGAAFVDNSLEDPNLKLLAAVAYGALGGAAGLLTGALIGSTQTRWLPVLLPQPATGVPRLGLALQVSR